jgi:hypothetical protein
MGQEAGWVSVIVISGEVDGTLMGILSVGSGLIARRDLEDPRLRRLVSRGLKMGAIVLALIIGPNLIGILLR